MFNFNKLKNSKLGKQVNESFKEPNPLNFLLSNQNEFSTIISDNANIITKNSHTASNNENNLVINKDEFFYLLEANKDEFSKNLNFNINDDVNLNNMRDNSIKTLNADLNILHSDLFLYTKFENSRPYKMLEYIMSNNESNSNNFNNNIFNMNNSNPFSFNNQAVSKNFLSSKCDKEAYEEIKKTIFNKPKTHLNEPKTTIIKTLFQYIKSDFSNSNIIKIFDKCNSKIEKNFKPGENYNPFIRDKFTYQNILIEKLKDNYNDDLLTEINDNDMLKSLIYIVNKNNKLGNKYKKISNAVVNNINCTTSYDNNLLSPNLYKDKINLSFKNKETDNLHEEINISNNLDSNEQALNINNNNGYNNLNNQYSLVNTLTNNYNFIERSFSEFRNSAFDYKCLRNSIEELNRKENCTNNCNQIDMKNSTLKKNDLLKRVKKALFSANYRNNKSKIKDVIPIMNNIGLKEENKIPENNFSNEQVRLKKFIYRKMSIIINDDNKKTIALIKTLRNKEQSIKLFCKILELFSKCREDDFEKIFKKLKDYLSGIDLDLVDNLDKILKGLNLENIDNFENEINKETKNSLINEEGDNANINSKSIDNLNSQNLSCIMNMQNLKTNNFDYIKENMQNPIQIIDSKNNNLNENNDVENNETRKNSKNKNSNNRNNLIKQLLNIKSFWINFRVLFSLMNILESSNPKNKLEYLSDEKFWRIIFSYVSNKDYKISKYNKIKKIKIYKETQKDSFVNELSENKDSCICNSAKKISSNKKPNCETNNINTVENIDKLNKPESGFRIRKKYKKNKLKADFSNLNEFLNNKNSTINNNSKVNEDNTTLSNKENSNNNDFQNEFFKNTTSKKKEEIDEITNAKLIKKEEREKRRHEKVQKKLEREKNKKLREEMKINKLNNKKDNENSIVKDSYNEKQTEKSRMHIISKEEKTEELFTLIEDDSKGKILVRIKNKIPLFDIFKKNGNLLKESFSNYQKNTTHLKINNSRKLKKNKNNKKKEKLHNRRTRGKYKKTLIKENYKLEEKERWRKIGFTDEDAFFLSF